MNFEGKWLHKGGNIFSYMIMKFIFILLIYMHNA
jgi:hypothetical protein